VLGLVGLTDVTFVHFEGIGISPEAAKKGFDRALLAIDEIVGGPRAVAYPSCSKRPSCSASALPSGSGLPSSIRGGQRT
jgi:hypothetical protein